MFLNDADLVQSRCNYNANLMQLLIALMQRNIFHYSTRLFIDRNVRGRNYDIQKVMELYESGLKPSEIAERLKINSVQSLRHTVERHKREKEITEGIISKIAEEKQAKRKSEQEKLENEAKRREIAEKQKLIAKIMPPIVGLFSYAIDTHTFKALEFVLRDQWNNSFLLIPKHRKYICQKTSILPMSDMSCFFQDFS